jgi:hypothetical protein
MASVREVYNALQDLANKDERGFISPENFNAFAPVAQTKVFNSIFDRLTGLERLRSTLSAPTTDRPVAFVSNEIVLYPKNVLRINLRYYKQPEGLTTAGVRTASLPKLGFTTVAGKEVYSDTGTIDFELPDHYVPDLVREMAMMVGINLRDQAVMNYSNQQPQQ